MDGITGHFLAHGMLKVLVGSAPLIPTQFDVTHPFFLFSFFRTVRGMNESMKSGIEIHHRDKITVVRARGPV